MKFSEADLCREFRTFLEESGYTVYPEVGTWDMIACRDVSRQSNLNFTTGPWQQDIGVQVGFQAKLLANVAVLHQAMESATSGPEIRMVLVPKASYEFIEVARSLGVGVVVKSVTKKYFGRAHQVDSTGFTIYSAPYHWESKPLWLPSISTDLVAGGASPKQLTKWREKSLGLCSLAKTRDLTTADFKSAGVDIKRWIAMDWLIPTGSSISPTTKRKIYTYRLGQFHPGTGWEQIQEQLEKHNKDKQ